MKKGVKIFFSCSLAATIFVTSSLLVFADPGSSVDPTVTSTKPSTTQDAQ